MSERWQVDIRVPASHPALEGHFPGNPLVPGVVLLELLLEAAAARLARPVHLRALPQAKFMSALRSEESAHGTLEVEHASTVDRAGGLARGAVAAGLTRVRFRLEANGRPVTSGTFVLGLA